MALSLNDWNALSTNDKDGVVAFLRGNCKVDNEHPESSPSTHGGYPIKNGTTSGGHDMKFGEEYRI